MGAHEQIKPKLDSIRVFMPEIGAEEYEMRRRMRSALDCALSSIGTTGGTERDLWIILRNHCEEWLLQPAPVETIAAASEVCTAIWRTVQRVIALNENIDLTAAQNGRG